MSSCAAGLDHGIDDMRITSTPADIAAHLPLYGFAFERVTFSQQSNRRYDLSGRAIPALKTIVPYKSRLHRMQPVVLRDALDRGNRIAVVHHGER
jgi:hypothetical protein